MFKAPFSFEGRIRRTEYWLSQLIQFMLWVACGALMEINEILGLVLLIPVIWFTLAYCTKRCHDRGNPGYWMIIPFYGFWMAFADSEPGPNQYGPNPKQNP
jgi:uncharacterized membrane protein YhaH (DUF805 family)